MSESDKRSLSGKKRKKRKRGKSKRKHTEGNKTYHTYEQST